MGSSFSLILIVTFSTIILHIHLLLAFSPSFSDTPLARTTQTRRFAAAVTTQQQSTFALSVASSASAPEEVEAAPTQRPLHQNWFPVSITTALHPDRPNAIELLSEKLVLYREEDGWKCLADRCSHRFAPLSEGRLISRTATADENSSACSSCSIQCAYHGWQFDSTGNCIKVPQYPSSSSSTFSNKAKPVPSFPCREEAGMIWVWADPNTTTWEMAESILLPISPLVRMQYKTFGAEACFMRDLPYGMELLGENLLDLSHLPFSHHNVGGLDRKMGVELPLRMMSEKERDKYASWEEDFLGVSDDYDKKKKYNIPLYQAEVLRANDTDPVLLSIGKRFPVSEDANATIAFFEPCHIRYRRERLPGTFGLVELFMCPTNAGKSRVFLWNTIYKPEEQVPAPMTFKSRFLKLSPLAAIKKAILAKLMNPATARAHSVAHLIFDGDGVFLHCQGNRMYENDLTFRDYSTPSSADVLLNAYRRYLDSAAKLSTKAAATAVSYQSGAAYGEDAPRSRMLDRYNSHTKHCNVCLKELGWYEKQRDVAETFKTALVGAVGASAAALIAVLFSSRVLPAAVARAVALSTMASFLGFIVLSKKGKEFERKIQSFKFEDYIHAEKDD